MNEGEFNAEDYGWTVNYMECDLCGQKDVHVYHESCEKLECTNCGNMSYHNIIKLEENDNN